MTTVIIVLAILAIIYITFVVAPQRELQAKERILKQVIEFCEKNGLDQSKEDKEQIIKTTLDTLGFPDPIRDNKDEGNTK